MPTKNSTTQIVLAELALDTYLRTLLDEIPEEMPAAAPEIVLPVVNTPKEPRIAAAAPKVSVPIAAAPVVVVEPPPVAMDLEPRPITGKALQPIKAPPKPEPAKATPAPETLKIRPLSVMPDWSRDEFQALFFRIDHLILATPLTELSRTLMFTRKPTKIPNQPSWFLGLLPDQGKNIGILDTAQLIFGKLRGQRDLIARPFPCLLITGDGNWGLACDEILSVGKLSPDKVRWRTLRTKRPWLIGTVTEELTAVIDVGQLIPRRTAAKVTSK